MILFLASDPGGAWDLGEHPTPKKLIKTYHFRQNMRAALKQSGRSFWNRRCLLISGDPTSHINNDEHVEVISKSFRRSFIPMKQMDICDSRNPEILNNIDDYDLIYLLGGYAPVQNDFFKSVDLASKLKNYKGVILTLSAGGMNCASTVYIAPEKEEDLATPPQERYMSGLGLTDIMLVPHFQWLKTLSISDKKLVDDVICNDSYGHTFIGLCDDSYYIINVDSDEEYKILSCTLYGNAYEIKDGVIKKL